MPATEIDVVERVRARYPPGTRLSFGAPTRCPRCGCYGLVERVDVLDGWAEHRCRPCGCTWTITVRALLAVDGPRLRRTAGSDPAVEALRHRRALATRLSASPDLAGTRFSPGPGGTVVRRAVTGANLPLPPPARPAPARPTRRAPPLPVRVLLVDHDPREVRAVRALIGPAGDRVIDLRTAATCAAGEVAARVSEPDLVLLALGLPDSRGVDTLTRWHAGGARSPVLVVSGERHRGGLDRRRRELRVAGIVDREELAGLLARGPDGSDAFVDLLLATSAPPGRRSG